MRGDHRERHALVIRLGMGEHQDVEPADPGLGEPAQDGPAGRSRVDEHGRGVALEQHRIALPDVEERDDQFAGCELRGSRAHQLHGDDGRRHRRDEDEDGDAHAWIRPASAFRDHPDATRRGRRRRIRTRASPSATGTAYARASPTVPPSRTGTAASGAPAAPCATHSR